MDKVILAQKSSTNLSCGGCWCLGDVKGFLILEIYVFLCRSVMNLLMMSSSLSQSRPYC